MDRRVKITRKHPEHQSSFFFPALSPLQLNTPGIQRIEGCGLLEDSFLGISTFDLVSSLAPLFNWTKGLLELNERFSSRES